MKSLTAENDHREVNPLDATIESNIRGINRAYAVISNPNHSDEFRIKANDKYNKTLRETIKLINQRVSAEESHKKVANDVTNREKQRESILKKYSTLLSQMVTAEKSWSSAKTGKTASAYSAIQKDIQNLKTYRSELDSGKKNIEEFDKEIQKVDASFKENSAVIKEAGKNAQSFTDKVRGLSERLVSYFGMSRLISSVNREIREMYQAVVDIDTAMTQFQIVTGATNTQMKEFADSAVKESKSIGSSITDLTSGATTYARLGYDMDASLKLSKFTSMLSNVGDIDVSKTQDAVTSIIKAYDIDVDHIESVMDKLVTTGNNFPISVDQIADGMTNASSTLSAAGNSFEQSVALLTAANTTIQNSSKASTGLRTIAARIRNTKTDLEDLGEAMTDSDYDKLVKSLTGMNVSLKDSNGEFRSTYDIIKDIAAQWDKMSSMEQAGIAETLSGTRQQAVFYSLVGQFKEASGSMAAMEDSAGSLSDSYSTYLDSIKGKTGQLKASFEDLSKTVIESDLVKTLVSGGTVFLDILKGIVGQVGLLPTLITGVATAAGALGKIKFFSLDENNKFQTDGIAKMISEALGSKGEVIDLQTYYKIDEQGNGQSVRERLTSILNDQDLTNGLNQFDNYNDKLLAINSLLPDLSQNLRDFILTNQLSDETVEKFCVGLEQEKIQLAANDKSFKNVKNIIETYNSDLGNLDVSQEQFIDSVRQGNGNLGQYLSTVGSGQATFRGYIGHLAKAKAATLGLQVVSTALNAALSFGISLLASAAISWIVGIFTDAAQAAEKAAERAREAAEEARKFKEELDEIEDYKTKVNDLVKAINSDNTSQSEAVEKRKQLLAIQEELIKKYGLEKEVIDGITGALKGEEDALNGVTKAAAQKEIQNNRDKYKESRKFLDESIGLDLDWSGSKAIGKTDGFNVNAIIDQFASNHAGFKVSARASNQGDTIKDYSKLKLSGTREEIIELYNELEADLLKAYNDLKKIDSSDQRLSDYEDILSKLTGARNYVLKDGDTWENNNEVVDTFIKNIILASDNMSKLYNKYQKSIDEYNEAVASGDKDAIIDAYNKVVESHTALMNSVDKDNGDLDTAEERDVRNWVKKQQENFNKIAGETPLKVTLKTEIETDEDNVANQLKNAISNVVGSDKKLKKSDLESLLLDGSQYGNAVQEYYAGVLGNWSKGESFFETNDAVKDGKGNTLTLDEYLNNKLGEGGSDNLNLISSLRRYVSDYNSIAQYTGAAQISIEELIDALVILGYVEDETAEKANSFKVSDYREQLDGLSGSVNTLNSAYEKFLKGDLSDADLFKLIYDKDNGFPELANYIDDLETGFKVIASKEVDKVLDELNKLDIDGFSDEELNTYKKLVEYLNRIKGGFNDVAAAQEKWRNQLSNTSSTIKTLVSMREEIEKNGKLSRDSVLSLIGDDKYRSIWQSLIDNDVAGYTKAINNMIDAEEKNFNIFANKVLDSEYGNIASERRNEIEEFKKLYDEDLDKYEKWSDERKESYKGTNAELLAEEKKILDEEKNETIAAEKLKIHEFEKYYNEDLDKYEKWSDEKKESYKGTNAELLAEEKKILDESIPEEEKVLKIKIAKYKKLYGIDLENWANLSEDKLRTLSNGNDDLINKQQELIEEFNKKYETDVTNFANAQEAKEALLEEFNKNAKQKLIGEIGKVLPENALTIENGSVEYSSEWYEQLISHKTTDKKLANDVKRFENYLNAYGLTPNDYLQLVNGTDNENTKNAVKKRSQDYGNAVVKSYNDIIKEFFSDVSDTSSGSNSGGNLDLANYLDEKTQSGNDTSKQTLDWIDRMLKQSAQETKEIYARVEDYINPSDKNNILDSAISSLGREISNNQSAYNAYMAAANSVDLSDYYKQLVRSGSLNIETITDADLREKISQYQDLYDKATNCKNAVRDLQKTEKDYTNQKFSNISTYYDNRIKDAQNTVDYYNSLDTDNLNVKKNYDEIRKAYQRQKADKEAEGRELQNALNSAVSSGTIKVGDSDWYKQKDAIDNCTKSVREYDKSIRDLANDNLTYTQDEWNVEEEQTKARIDELKAGSEDKTRNQKTDYAALKKEYNQYYKNKNAEADELEKGLNDAVKNGDIEKGSKRFNEWTKNISDTRSEARGLKKDLHELAVEELDDIQTEWDNQIDASKENIESLRADAEDPTQGYVTDYVAIEEELNTQLSLSEQKSGALAKRLKEALDSGDIEKGSEEWRKFNKEIQDSVDNTKELRKELHDLAVEELNNIVKESDKAANRFERYNKRLETINSDPMFVNNKDYGTIRNNYLQESNEEFTKSQRLQRELEEGLKNNKFVQGDDDYEEIINKIYEADNNVFELTKKIRQTYLDEMSDKEAYYNNLLKERENQIKYEEARKENSDKVNRWGYESYFTNTVMKQYEANRADLIKEKGDLLAGFNKAVRNGMQEGSEAWNEWQEKLKNVDIQIEENDSKLNELSDTMRDLPIEKFEYFVELLTKTRDLIKGLASLHEAQGLDKTADEIYSSINSGMTQIDALMRERDELLRKMENGEYGDVNSSDWVAALEKYLSIEESIRNMQIEQEQSYDNLIDLGIQGLNKEKELLQKQNSELEKKLSLEKAILALEKARYQKNKLVYREGVGFVYEADQNAIRDAQEQLDNQYQQNVLDYFDKVIDLLEEYKKTFNIYDYSGNELSDTAKQDSNLTIDGERYTQLIPTSEYLSKAFVQMNPEVAQLYANALSTVVPEKLTTDVGNATKYLSQISSNFANVQRPNNIQFTISDGAIHLYGVNDVSSLSRTIVDQLPSQLIQDMNKK